MLRLEAVRKTYGSSVVLADIGLEVPAHTVTALIGASGSGKSTLLRCVNLLEEVDDGAVFLDGAEITDPRTDQDAVRRRIGVVFQSYNLFPHMTVLDNITLAPRRVHGVPRGARRGAGAGAAGPAGAGRPGQGVPRPAQRRSAAAGGAAAGGGHPARGCCCSTRSPRRSTRNWSARCWRWSGTSRSRA